MGLRCAENSSCRACSETSSRSPRPRPRSFSAGRLRTTLRRSPAAKRNREERGSTEGAAPPVALSKESSSTRSARRRVRGAAVLLNLLFRDYCTGPETTGEYMKNDVVRVLAIAVAGLLG